MQLSTRHLLLFMLLAFGVHMAVAAADRVPWQRRIGKNVDIHHKKQHERVRPDMWPAEPPTLKDVNVAKFTDALKFLCGGRERMPGDRSAKYAGAILDNADRFDVDPFLMAALIFDQSRCLPKQPDNETRYGLSRIDVDMHAPHVRNGRYIYFILDNGEWQKRDLDVSAFPFNQWKAAHPLTNIFWTAAILHVFYAQSAALAEAFPQTPHRHPVSHWFFGDNVRNSEPEDRVLTARRRMLQYYQDVAVIPAGDYNGLPLVSPLDGVPRMVLDDFGYWRGTKRQGHTHQGVDLVAEMDEPIRAVADGRVTFAGADMPGAGSRQLTPEEAAAFRDGPIGAGGLYVAIRHEGGLRSYYMHMDTFIVAERQEVKAGDIIGTVGRSGATDSGAHLHLEFRVGEERVDPAVFLAPVLVDPKRLAPTAE